MILIFFGATLNQKDYTLSFFEKQQGKTIKIIFKFEIEQSAKFRERKN